MKLSTKRLRDAALREITSQRKLVMIWQSLTNTVGFDQWKSDLENQKADFEQRKLQSLKPGFTNSPDK